MKKHKRHFERGFTLLELLVVIAIIGLFASIITTTMNSARNRARAARIAADLRLAQKSWEVWRTDTGGPFVHEDIYGNVNAAAPCQDEPVLAATDLSANVSGKLNWRGPYISGTLRDPFGNQYAYDNDGDTWPDYFGGGVSVALEWCSQSEIDRYGQIVPLIDQIFDHGDGSTAGSFRYGVDSSFLLIAPSSNQ